LSISFILVFNLQQLQSNEEPKTKEKRLQSRTLGKLLKKDQFLDA